MTSRNLRPFRLALWVTLGAAVLGLGGEAPAKAAAVSSDVMKAPRPAGGEYLGLYLSGKKIGYLFSQVERAPGHRVQATSQFVFKATVGDRVAERSHRETRIYEDRPRGKLLSLKVEDHGDGGEQTLLGTASASGITLRRQRPGVPEETLHVPATEETVEDADSPRVALFENKTWNGHTLDASDLSESKVTTTVFPAEERIVGGVKVRLRKATTLSEKDKVPLDAWVTDDGRMVEVTFGQSMRGQAEPKSVATRIDKVEIFALTRVVLPKALPANVRDVPQALKLVVSGLAPSFQKESYRQSFAPLPGGQAEVTLRAVPPASSAIQDRPLSVPGGPEFLKSTIVVESDDPAIRAKARLIVGGEKNSYAAAKLVVEWVYRNMKKGYGTSSDRATDVLRQMKGDCTEHSLLAEALLRAAGIPARRIDGLVYVVNEDGVPALYWHEWVEAYVGVWTQMDPTFGEAVADATHFAVGEESNAEITPLLGQLKVLQVL